MYTLSILFSGSQYPECVPQRFHAANPQEVSAASVGEMETNDPDLERFIDGILVALQDEANQSCDSNDVGAVLQI